MTTLTVGTRVRVTDDGYYAFGQEGTVIQVNPDGNVQIEISETYAPIVPGKACSVLKPMTVATLVPTMTTSELLTAERPRR